MAWLFLSSLPLAPRIPFLPPLYSPLLTWRPPAVTELSSLLSGYLQTDPTCPSLHPINPFIPSSRNPNSSAPDNDDIGATSLPLCGTIMHLHVVNTWEYFQFCSHRRNILLKLTFFPNIFIRIGWFQLRNVCRGCKRWPKRYICQRFLFFLIFIKRYSQLHR